MVTILCNDIKRSIWAPRFGVTLLSLWAILLEPIAFDLLNSNGHLDSATAFGISINNGLFVIIAPLACCIPFAASFLEEKELGVLPFYWARCGYTKQIIARCISIFCSGALVLLISTSLFAIGLRLYLPDLSAKGMLGNPMLNLVWETLFTPEKADLYLCAQIALIALFGGVWSVLGMSLGLMANARFVSWVGPFVVYFTLFYFMPIIGLSWFNPGQLLVPSYLPLPFLLLYQASILCFAVYQIYRNTRRKGGRI